ncbi:phage major capsid protein [Cytobacillus oceanisediminis]|uniref:phage major capsid protein n=1 Tax=Cytobacillus oceanisediminis TaxID=665099 RepID=UPI00204029DC|nr:phage major capsid protein [Cytobacillus oceanisediminis]MCM3241323.1 phage major capsid protein [Cytobacillus oceanisediminis]
MALKQLMLAKKIEQRKSLLAELTKKEEGFATRSAQLETAISEANEEDEIKTVEEEIEKHEQEKADHSEQKSKLEGEIAELEGELEELNNQAPDNTQRSAATPKPKKSISAEGEERMKVNKYETRSQMLDRLNQEEVREFYSKVSQAALDKRAIANTDIVIPESVINMIQTRLGDYSTLYREVTVQQLNGTARIIMDGAIPEAIWTEMCDPVQELATSFSQTELDGFKVGGFIPVCNAVLEDSMIGLANFIEERLAMAIGKAIDKAILSGAGSASKQPLGVINALTGVTERNVTSDFTLKDIVGNMALIDDGEDGVPVGEVIAVMKRSTYYSRIAPQTFQSTSDGRLVIQGTQSPRLPDGTRVVFSQYAPADTIVMGDFKKYLLGERKGVQLAVSTDVRFIQDETVFKGTARYDGKPIYNDYFVVITYAPAV